MRNLLTPHDIANTIRMMRSLHSGVILIVEGYWDLQVYKRFVNETHCQLTHAYGKDNAIDALSILENDNFKGVLVIVDSDFWKLENINPNTSNILLTDFHDLESMIIKSNALDKVMSMFGSETKITNMHKSIQEILLESALPIGFLRWLSSETQDNLFLKFKKLSFDSFVDKMTLYVDVDKLIKIVKFNSQNNTLDEKTIKNELPQPKGLWYQQ